MAYHNKNTGHDLEIIGPLGNLYRSLSADDHTAFLRMGVLFLENAVGIPPDGTRLDIELISDTHCEDRLIVLIIEDEQKLDEDTFDSYRWRGDKALALFADSVDWESLSKDVVQVHLRGQTYHSTADLLSPENFVDPEEEN